MAITTVVKTIGSGGDFTTLQSWEDAKPLDLTDSRSSTTQAGSTSSTIVLDASASGTAGAYVGHAVYCTARPTEKRLITAYNETSKTATVGSLNGSSATWANTPGTETFAIDQCIWQGQIKNATDYFVGALYANVLTISGSTSSSTCYAELTTAPGASWRDNAAVATNALRYNPSNGCAIEGTPAFTKVIEVTEYAHLSNLQCFATAMGGATDSFGFTNTITQNCILDFDADHARVCNGGSLINCLIVSRGNNPTGAFGVYVTPGASTSNIIGCTIVNSKANGYGGVGRSYFSVNIQNCAIFGFLNPILDQGGTPTWTITTCATDCSTASHPGWTFSIPYSTATFQNVTESTRDYRLASGSGLIGIGTTDSTNQPTDIRGTTRPQGTGYDIGCWEFAVAPGHDAYLAFDGDPSTYALSGLPLSTQSYWIEIDLGSVVPVGTYTYQARADGVFNAWKTWILEGSLNNSTWTLVDTVTSEPDFAAGEIRSYACDAPGAYRYYRWTVTASEGLYADVAGLALYDIGLRVGVATGTGMAAAIGLSTTEFGVGLAAGTGTATGVSPGILRPLDIAAGAIVAYSQRQLKSNNNVLLLTLRRSSDNAITNLPFVAGDIDPAAVTTWLAGSFGFTQEIWDQSGNNVHLTQFTDSKQPSWTSSVVGSRPGILFDTVNSKELASASGFTATTDAFTIFAVYKYNMAANGSGYLFYAGTGSGHYVQLLAAVPGSGTAFSVNASTRNAPDVPNITYGVGTGSTSNVDLGTANPAILSDIQFQDLLTATYSSNISGVEFKSVPFVTGNTGTISFSNLPFYLSLGGIDCYLCELIVYPTVLLATDRVAIRQNILDYYSLDAPGFAAGTATGQGIAAAQSPSTDTGAGLATGTGAATGNGRSDVYAIAAAAGQGAATATGRDDGFGVGAAAGLGTATADGRSNVRSVGNASGLGTATGQYRADTYTTGSSAGLGAAVGSIRTDARSVGNAAGTGTAVGIAEVGTSSGMATGTGTASGVGRADGTGVGAASGLGTAVATGRTDCHAAGNASGLGSCNGISTADVRSVGNAAGIGVAIGIAVETDDRFGTGACAGQGTATGNGRSDARAVGNASGVGTATASGRSDVHSVGNAAGLGTAEAIGVAGSSRGQLLTIAYHLDAGQATGKRRAGGIYLPPTQVQDASVEGALLHIDYYLFPGRAVAERNAKLAGASLEQDVFVIAGRARGQRVGLISGHVSAAATIPGIVLHVEHLILRDDSIDADNVFLLSDDHDFPFAA